MYIVIKRIQGSICCSPNIAVCRRANALLCYIVLVIYSFVDVLMNLCAVLPLWLYVLAFVLCAFFSNFQDASS